MSRSKPIVGMWFTLIALSVAISMTGFTPQAYEPLFGMWPTAVVVWLIVALFLVVWLIVALFFDWVVQSTGLGAVQVAVILALTQILGLEVGGVMMEGMAFGDALITAGFKMLFWVFPGGVYSWLSD